MKNEKYAAFGNKIWEDANANGIQDAGEAGIAGVKLQLKNIQGAVIQTTYTDANGNYNFEAKPGAYRISLQTPDGFIISPKDRTNDRIDSDFNSATKTTDIINGGAGKQDYTIDGGLYRLAKLGGTVWNDRNYDGGQNEMNDNVANVKVLLLDANGVATGNSTLTDAGGNYLFSGLKPGTYSVQFDTKTLPSGLGFSSFHTGDGNDSDSDVFDATGKTGQITLHSGQTDTTLDAGLINLATPVQFTAGAWIDTNANGIRDIGEHGVPSVVFSLINETGSVVASGGSPLGFDGDIPFTVAPGKYQLAFSNVPSSYHLTARDQGQIGIDPVTLKSDWFTLESGKNFSISAGFVPTLMTVGGSDAKVWYDINADGIRGSNEPGVQGVTVNLLVINDGFLDIVATTTTDANGNYQFQNMNMATSYIVSFSNIGSDKQFTLQNVNGLPDTLLDSDANADGFAGTVDVNHPNYISAGIRDIVPASATSQVSADNSVTMDSSSVDIVGVSTVQSELI